MTNLKRIINLLRCPNCSNLLDIIKNQGNNYLKCLNNSCGLKININDCNIPIFSPNLDSGKYNEEYALKYAGIWSYGFKLFNYGENESLYRTANEMLLSSSFREKTYNILDVGCGVGRFLLDCGKNYKNAVVVGIDGSIEMLKRSWEIVVNTSEVNLDLKKFGFNVKKISGNALRNIVLIQTDAHSLPFLDNSFDFVASLNLIDRVEKPAIVLKEIYRVLNNRGIFIFTNPLNWISRENWKCYPTAKSIIALFKEIGFSIEEWFDNLYYREIQDSRKSYTDWNTLVIKAKK